MYARSKRIRKFSSTPVVWYDEAEDKETYLFTVDGKKKEADDLADAIVDRLNSDKTAELKQLLRTYKGIINDKSSAKHTTEAQRIILATQVSVMKAVVNDIERMLGSIQTPKQ
jgi:hypothetical protein